MLHNLRTMPLRGPVSETARIAAIRELLDRGYGRSRQAMEISAPAGVFTRFDDYGAAPTYDSLTDAVSLRSLHCSPKFNRTNHSGWHRGYPSA
jgi:hypothetical protein